MFSKATVLQRTVYATTYLCNHDCEKVLVLSILTRVGKTRNIFYQFVIINLWSAMIQATEHLESLAFCVWLSVFHKTPCLYNSTCSTLKLWWISYCQEWNYHKEKKKSEIYCSNCNGQQFGKELDLPLNTFRELN